VRLGRIVATALTVAIPVSGDTWASYGRNESNQTGTVRMAGYMEWLRSNGYCFAGDACDRPPQ
jgi:hypothetical protein